MSAHFMLAQPEVVEQLAGSTRETLAGAIDKYGGPSRWHLEASSAPVPSFGWKDPRNTFTLPVWKQIFPNLRVIHIIRHGVDAAASLTRRHGKAMRAATGESVPSALTVIRDHTLGILSSRRGWTLPEAFTMWEQYVEKARQECAALGARALEIRYEDLLVQPDEVVPVIAKFCGVPVQGQQAALREGLERGRAFAFRGDPDLVDFAGYAHQALVRYGYAA
jgi:hypothetical protein